MSTIIRTRSPYFIRTPEVTASTLSYFQIVISIKQGIVGVISCPANLGNFTLNKKPIGAENSVSFDISEIVNDFIEQKFNSNTTGGYTVAGQNQSVWVTVTTSARTSSGTIIGSATSTVYLAQEGYNTFKEGVNYTTQQNALITSNYIQHNKGDLLYLPVNVENVNSVTYKLNGVTISSVNTPDSTDSKLKIKYLSFNTTSQQIDEIEINYGDQTIRTIKVELIDECKYSPFKIVFINRWGALQDLFFFKKSTESLNTTRENFNASIFYANKVSYSLRDEDCNIVNTFNTYSTTDHVKKTFNSNGTETINLNTGFVNELINPSFQELMVSEYVWLVEDSGTGFGNQNIIYPVNLKESSFTKKTGLNDKMINYTMSFEKSFSIVNNIR